MATTDTQKTDVKCSVILMQRYDGVCGGLAGHVETDAIIGVFESIEAFYRFWGTNFKSSFDNGEDPFDPRGRRDGLYLKRCPLVTDNSNMKKAVKMFSPIYGWGSLKE